MTYTFNRPAFPATRMRRIRKNDQLRAMVSETQLTANHLIYPVFVLPGQQQSQDIPSMPNVQRLSADLLLKKAESLLELGVSKLALFPVTPQQDKSLMAEAAWHEDGLVQNTCRLLKKELPEMVLITDGALDPYTTHGQDGIIDDTGYVLNDETVEALVKQALSHAEAGADVIAPSDMIAIVTMNVKIGDVEGHMNVCLPFFTLEDVMDKLNTKYWFSTMQKESTENYSESLEAMLKRVDVPVRAVLGKSLVSVNDFINLQPGDVIRLGTGVASEMDVYVGNIKKFTALPGSNGDKYAVRVMSVIREEE